MLASMTEPLKVCEGAMRTRRSVVSAVPPVDVGELEAEAGREDGDEAVVDMMEMDRVEV